MGGGGGREKGTTKKRKSGKKGGDCPRCVPKKKSKKLPRDTGKSIRRVVKREVKPEMRKRGGHKRKTKVLRKKRKRPGLRAGRIRKRQGRKGASWQNERDGPVPPSVRQVGKKREGGGGQRGSVP